jgi:hypothetical protein
VLISKRLWLLFKVVTTSAVDRIGLFPDGPPFAIPAVDWAALTKTKARASADDALGPWVSDPRTPKVRAAHGFVSTTDLVPDFSSFERICVWRDDSRERPHNLYAAYMPRLWQHNISTLNVCTQPCGHLHGDTA